MGHKRSPEKQFLLEYKIFILRKKLGMLCAKFG